MDNDQFDIWLESFEKELGKSNGHEDNAEKPEEED